MSDIKSPGSHRIQPIRIHGEVEGGGLDNKPLSALPEIVLNAELKSVMANVQVMGRLQPTLAIHPLDKVLVVTDEGIAREAIAVMRDLCMERDIALISPSTAVCDAHEHMLGRLTQGRELPLFDAEKIQALTDTAREFGGNVDKDVIMSIPSGVSVEFTKLDIYGVGVDDFRMADSVAVFAGGDFDGDSTLLSEEVLARLIKRRLRAELRCKAKRGPKRKGFVSVRLLRREQYLRDKVSLSDPLWVF